MPFTPPTATNMLHVTPTEKQVRLLAAMGYEAARAFGLALGGRRLRPWEQASPWWHEVVINSAQQVLRGRPPAELHQLWCEYLFAHGWRLGETTGNRQHPFLIAYDQLPEHEQQRWQVFYDAVRTLLTVMQGADKSH